jgi:hypothetical protein
MITQQTEVNADGGPELKTSVSTGPGARHTVFDILRTVLDPVEQGIILIDGDLMPIYANRRACQILSAQNEDEVARIVECNCSKKIFEQCREKRKAVTYLDVTLPVEGRRKLLGLEVFFLDQPTVTPSYLVLMHDFSDWKKLDDLRSRFATSLSHCMRTPLTAIRNVHGILGEEGSIPGPDKERLLEIGWRNIEKLIAQLDELQKVFMIESEEINVCRTLVRVRNLLKPVFADLEHTGKIKGFKLRVADITSLTGRGRLSDFISAAAEAYGKWMGEAPFIECVSSMREDFHHNGTIEKKFKLSLRPRFAGHHEEMGESLKDFLSFREAHRGLVLDRLATVLDGEMEIGAGNTISLLLPIHPPFDREKDLVHPLHMMTERAELANGEFHLVSLRMIGMVDGEVRFTRLLESSLCSCIIDDGIVSRGEEPFTYSIFIANRSSDEVSEILRSVQDRFVRSCWQSGEEIYPSIRYDIRHSRTPGVSHDSPEKSLVEIV